MTRCTDIHTWGTEYMEECSAIFHVHLRTAPYIVVYEDCGWRKLNDAYADEFKRELSTGPLSANRDI